MQWIDTHCHLDALEFSDPAFESAEALRAKAAAQGVALCVIPAVEGANFAAVRLLAHRSGDAYGLGIHPLYVPQASDLDLDILDQQLQLHQHDPRLVAVGEIGLDFFVPAMCRPEMREKQEHFYQAQLRLAHKYDLPVVLHVRRSADRLLKYLREPHCRVTGGIAHAFNGSVQQAQAFTALGFKLGFGGAVTFTRATQLHRLAQALPLDALVMETDAPDIAPQWLYATAQERSQGVKQRRNTPAELPRIAQVVAELRGLPLQTLAEATTRNACRALPRLSGLLAGNTAA